MSDMNTDRHLKPGAYVAEIINLDIRKTRAGTPYLIIALDIAEGECKGWYHARYQAARASWVDHPDGPQPLYRGTLRVYPADEGAPDWQRRSWEISKRVLLRGARHAVAGWPGMSDLDALRAAFNGATVGITVREASYNGCRYTEPYKLWSADTVRAGKVRTPEPKQDTGSAS